MAKNKQGCACLVNAGPGDPIFLTRQGEDALRRADVVLFDDTVNSEVRLLAPGKAEFISTQEWLIRNGKSLSKLAAFVAKKTLIGKQVVLLCGGIISGEIAEALAAAKAPIQLVPGVSIPEAAAYIAGFPLVHADVSHGYTFINDLPDSKGDFNAQIQDASASGTLVVQTRLDRVPAVADALLKQGRAGDTQATLIRWAGAALGRVQKGPLSELLKLESNQEVASQAALIVGQVAKLAATASSSTPRSLAGKTVVVTRARNQAEPLLRALRNRGSEVLGIPVIKIERPHETLPLAEALLSLNGYDWIVFTSSNGVTQFFQYFFVKYKDMRDIGGARIAAVGPGTAERIEELHLQVDVIPDDFTAANVAKTMGEFESLENRRVLLLRAEVANPELPKKLEDLGAIVDDIACYRTEGETTGSERESEQLRTKGADWVTFTSGSTVEHFHARFDLPALRKKFPALQIASIGPETSRALKALGITPEIEAKPHTLDAMVAAIESTVASESER